LLLSPAAKELDFSKTFGSCSVFFIEILAMHRNVKYVVRKAAALMGRRQWEEAAEAYQQALQLSPGYSAAVQGLDDAMKRLA
jgi:tetratricopeptide (TPR) repeat protein